MDFPTGTTAVLVNGKHVSIAQYRASMSRVNTPPDDVRARTSGTGSVPPLAGAVLEAAGVTADLVDVLEIAGFVTAVSIRDADPKDLVDIPGIGKVTARKLQDAAAQLLAAVPEPVEGGNA